jgi:hypothetical protein
MDFQNPLAILGESLSLNTVFGENDSRPNFLQKKTRLREPFLKEPNFI